MTRFSVIISAFNASATIERCLHSALSQDYHDFEVLVMDDGSSDDTLAKCNALKALHPNLFIFSRQNCGLSTSLNELVNHATGDWLVRLDADDEMSTARLSMTAEFIHSKKNPKCISSLVSVKGYDGGERVKKIPKNHLVQKWRLKYYNIFVHGALCFDKKFFESIGGYNSSYRFSQDLELILRFIKHTKVHVINQPLYTLYQHPNSISVKNKNRQLFYCLKAICKANGYKLKKDIIVALTYILIIQKRFGEAKRYTAQLNCTKRLWFHLLASVREMFCYRS